MIADKDVHSYSCNKVRQKPWTKHETGPEPGHYTHTVNRTKFGTDQEEGHYKVRGIKSGTDSACTRPENDKNILHIY